MAREPEARACAVCGDVVDAVTKSDASIEYRHTLATLEDGRGDHVVVPVTYGEIRVNTRCDFCTVDGARWVLPVESYEVMPGWNSSGDWGACDDCAAALLANDWRKVAYRAMQAHRARGGIAGKAEFDALYVQLRKHVLGPVQLWRAL